MSLWQCLMMACNTLRLLLTIDQPLASAQVTFALFLHMHLSQYESIYASLSLTALPCLHVLFTKVYLADSLYFLILK